MLNRRSSIVALAVVALAIGCGGSALEPPRSPEPKSGPLSELDSLEQDLEADERRLFGSLDDKQAYSQQPQTQGPGAGSGLVPEGAAPPAPPSPAPAPERPSADATSDREAAAPSRVVTPCEVACRSFTSMRRSAARICELAGEADERCPRARDRVGRARDYLAAARCTCANEN